MFSLPGGGASTSGMSMGMIQARKDRRGKRADLPDEIVKRLKSCSVLNCEDWRDLSSYTTYHCFPTGEKNQDRWEIWTGLLRKVREDETWIPFRGSLVCSHHFRTEDFVNDPLSKRRKLNKNAIPSIFPTFNVDLSDPSYQVADDETGQYDEAGNLIENENSNEYSYGDVNSFVDEDTEFLNDYEYSSPDGQDDYNEAPIVMQTTSGSMNFGNDDEEDDNAQSFDPLEEIHSTNRPVQVSSKAFMNQINGNMPIQRLRKVPLLTPVAPVSRNPPKMVQGTGTSRGSPIRMGQNRHSLSSSASSASSSYSVRERNMAEETVKSLNALPFSLNPDLEIELIDPEEDLAVCRLRICELEQQNRSLTTMYENALESIKQKYESQISNLRKRLQQQDRLLANNQLSGNTPAMKKVRLS